MDIFKYILCRLARTRLLETPLTISIFSELAIFKSSWDKTKKIRTILQPMGISKLLYHYSPNITLSDIQIRIDYSDLVLCELLPLFA